MPLITNFDAPIAIKPYSVAVTITTKRRVWHKVITGLCAAGSTARHIADDQANVWGMLFVGNCEVWVGPVTFGPVHAGHLPAAGFYVDGRRIALPEKKTV